MKFSTLTKITSLLQIAVKTSGQNVTNATVGTDAGQPATLDVVNIDFMFPIVKGVSSILQETMDEMVGEFNKLNPDIKVNAIYSGSYGQTFEKVVARIDANDPPAVAVLNINRMVELNAMDAISPLNSYIKEAGGWYFLDDFYPSMLENEIVRPAAQVGHLSADEKGTFDGSLCSTPPVMK